MKKQIFKKFAIISLCGTMVAPALINAHPLVAKAERRTAISDQNFAIPVFDSSSLDGKPIAFINYGNAFEYREEDVDSENGAVAVKVGGKSGYVFKSHLFPNILIDNNFSENFPIAVYKNRSLSADAYQGTLRSDKKFRLSSPGGCCQIECEGQTFFAPEAVGRLLFRQKLDGIDATYEQNYAVPVYKNPNLKGELVGMIDSGDDFRYKVDEIDYKNGTVAVEIPSGRGYASVVHLLPKNSIKNNFLGNFPIPLYADKSLSADAHLELFQEAETTVGSNEEFSVNFEGEDCQITCKGRTFYAPKVLIDFLNAQRERREAQAADILKVLNKCPEIPVPNVSVANPWGELEVPQGAKITSLTHDSALPLQIVDPTQPLFKDPPSLNGINQENIGNCYLLASLIAMLSRNPADIYVMFKDLRNGKIIVCIFAPDGTEQYFELPRAYPRGKFNPENAEWARALEATYGAFLTGSTVISEKTYAAIRGGAPDTLFPKEPLKHFVARKPNQLYEILSIPDFPQKKCQPPCLAQLKKPGEYPPEAIQFFEKLLLLQDYHSSAIRASTPLLSKMDSCCVLLNHAYGVLRLLVDKTAAGKEIYIVELANPWGFQVPIHGYDKSSNTWISRASDGGRLERGSGGNHGRFRMDILQFMACFESVIFTGEDGHKVNFVGRVVNLINELQAHRLNSAQTERYITDELDSIATNDPYLKGLAREEQLAEFRKVLGTIALTREEETQIVLETLEKFASLPPTLVPSLD